MKTEKLRHLPLTVSLILVLLTGQDCRSSSGVQLLPDPPRAGDTLTLHVSRPYVVAVEIHFLEGGRQVRWLDVDTTTHLFLPASAAVLRLHAFPRNAEEKEIFIMRLLQDRPESRLWAARLGMGDPELSAPGDSDTATFRTVLQRYPDHPLSRVWQREIREKTSLSMPESLTARFQTPQEAYAWYVLVRAHRKSLQGAYDTLQNIARWFFAHPSWPDLPEMIRWGAYAFSRSRDRTVWLEGTRHLWEGRPGEGPLWEMLAEGRLERGDTAGAQKAFSRAWQVMPTPDVLLSWMDLLKTQADTTSLLRLADTLEALPPVWRDPRLAFRSAKAHRRWWEESMADLELSLSTLLLSRGDTAKARRFAEHAYTRTGEYPPRDARAWMLGRLLLSTRDTAGAETLLLEALSFNPARESARQTLLSLYHTHPAWDAEETLRVRLFRRMGARDTLADLPLREIATGDTLRLQDFRGRIVVLNFWATWCGPCRHEIPLLNQLVERYRTDTGVVFLGITDERPSVVKRFLKSHPFAYRVFLTPAYRKVYRITGIPTHLVADAEGRVIFRHVGSEPAIHERLDREIQWVRDLTRSRETVPRPPESPRR